MKVAYVTMLFPVPSETFASNDVRALAERGIEMAVHSLRPAARETSELVAQRRLESVSRTYNTGFMGVMRGLWVAVRRPRVAVDLVAVLFRRSTWAPEHLFKSLVLVPRVLEVFGAIGAARPDVVHAFWSSFPSMVVFLVQRHMPGVVTSISFGAHDIVMGYGLAGPVAMRADFVRTLGRVNVPQIQKRFGVPASRIEVVHNGVDLSLVPPPSERVPRSIVTAGRLVENKGMEQVLEVFARARETWPDVSLKVLGTGPLLRRLRTLAEHLGVASAVTFMGHVSQRDVLQEMRRAEVFLFMSETDYDRLPNVVKEAMVCGCLCVATATDGIDELIAHGHSGFVIRRGDVESAVQHVKDVFSGRVARMEMAQAAETWIRSEFDFRNSICRYQERWNQLIHQKRSERSARSEA